MALIPTLQTSPQPTNPAALALQRQYAQALLAGSQSDKPLGSWTQGLAEITKALVGGTISKNANEDETAARAAANTAMVKALTGGTGEDAMAASGSPWLTEGQRTELMGRQLQQTDPMRALQMQKEKAQIARMGVPEGFQSSPDGLAPMTGGPADPAYIERVTKAKAAPPMFDAAGGATDDNINPMAAASVSDAAFGPPGTRNEKLLDQLPPDMAGIVKGLANYELDLRQISSVRGNQRLQLAAAAKAYDPTFDMTQYGARAAMRKSITSGTYSQALNSANLVIQHLDALSKSIDGLNNSDLKPRNAVTNMFKNQTGDPAITKFNTARDAAAAELAKVFKGTGASDVQSIQEWRNNLDINGSPAQIRQSIATAVGDLLKSRIDTIQNQFQAAMGHPADFSYLTPHSRQVLTDLGIDPASLDPSAAAAAPVGQDPFGTKVDGKDQSRIGDQPQPSLDDLLKKYGG